MYAIICSKLAITTCERDLAVIANHFIKKTPSLKTYHLEAEQWPKIQLEWYESLGKEQNKNHSYFTA